MLEEAIKALRDAGNTVTKSSDFPSGLPALYEVNGNEMTEMQVIAVARSL